MNLNLPPFYNIVVVDETTSTNDDAKNLAADGAPHGTLVWARRQTGGRGRQGNAWESPAGNLYMSLVMRPAIAPGEAGQMSFVVGVAVAEALAPFLPVEGFVELKWPNDILVRGKKLGGILIESEILEDRLSWVVLGVGVNVVTAPDYAISLQAAGARDVTVESILEAVCGALLHWIQVWREDGFGPVRKAWLRRAHGMGEALTARLPRETLEGVFAGLDDQGALLLDIGGGDVLRITAGEVFFG